MRPPETWEIRTFFLGSVCLILGAGWSTLSLAGVTGLALGLPTMDTSDSAIQFAIAVVAGVIALPGFAVAALGMAIVLAVPWARVRSRFREKVE